SLVPRGRMAERHAEHGAEVFHQSLRLAPPLTVLVRGEPVHLAVTARGEPRLVVLARRGGIQRGHAHGVEAQRERARLEARGRLDDVVRQSSPVPGGLGGFGAWGLAPRFQCFFSESAGAPCLSVSVASGAGFTCGGSCAAGGGGVEEGAPPDARYGRADSNSRRAAPPAPCEPGSSAARGRPRAGPGPAAGLRGGPRARAPPAA